MGEKRRSPRYAVQNVEGTLLFNTEARIANLSLTGMAVETGSALRVGRDYALTLRHGSDALRLTGVVAWCKLARTRRTASGESAPVYEAGMRFDGMLSERAEQLLHLLEESAIISLETRIAGRFKVPEGAPVSMESQAGFLVTEVSASGLQIESEVAPEVDSVLVVDLRLPGGAVHAGCRVASVRSTDAGHRPAVHLLGLEFRDITEEHREVFEAFIADELHGGAAPAADS
jgi:c-di-GMP-binding flagellar brake protein YcgR